MELVTVIVSAFALVLLLVLVLRNPSSVTRLNALTMRRVTLFGAGALCVIASASGVYPYAEARYGWFAGLVLTLSLGLGVFYSWELRRLWSYFTATCLSLVIGSAIYTTALNKEAEALYPSVLHQWEVTQSEKQAQYGAQLSQFKQSEKEWVLALQQWEAERAAFNSRQKAENERYALQLAQHDAQINDVIASMKKTDVTKNFDKYSKLQTMLDALKAETFEKPDLKFNNPQPIKPTPLPALVADAKPIKSAPHNAFTFITSFSFELLVPLLIFLGQSKRATASVPTASVPTASVPTASVPTASVPTASVPTASVPCPVCGERYIRNRKDRSTCGKATCRTALAKRKQTTPTNVVSILPKK